MPVAKVGSVNLQYEVAGDPVNPAIVLISGLGLPAAFWPHEFVAGLVRGGFCVVMFDNRDAGGSSRIGRQVGTQEVGMAIGRALLKLSIEGAPYTLSDMARDTEGLIAHLGLRKVHLVGLSMGGMIAQEVAAEFPNRVRSLTSVMSASGNSRTGLGKAKTLQAMFVRPESVRTEDYLQNVLESIAGTGFKTPKATIRDAARKLARHFDEEGTARQLLAILASGDRRPRLGQISAPTLVIHGDEDPLLPLAAGREVAACVANSAIRIIPGLGHELPPGACTQIAEAICEHCHAAG